MGSSIGCTCILSFREELELSLQLYWFHAHIFLSYDVANGLVKLIHEMLNTSACKY